MMFLPKGGKIRRLYHPCFHGKWGMSIVIRHTHIVSHSQGGGMKHVLVFPLSKIMCSCNL